ncbi:MAG TPA: hypothetical protein PK358_09660 [Spirochaetota bacterium]|nr:hypothetical protein [Spirochaetota bacterium]
MRINRCRKCRYYMIDDGKELLCCFRDYVSYLEIKTDSYGYAVCRCPGEYEFGKIPVPDNYR